MPPVLSVYPARSVVLLAVRLHTVGAPGLILLPPGIPLGSYIPDIRKIPPYPQKTAAPVHTAVYFCLFSPEYTPHLKSILFIAYLKEKVHPQPIAQEEFSVTVSEKPFFSIRQKKAGSFRCRLCAVKASLSYPVGCRILLHKIQFIVIRRKELIPCQILICSRITFQDFCCNAIVFDCIIFRFFG